MLSVKNFLNLFFFILIFPTLLLAEISPDTFKSDQAWRQRGLGFAETGKVAPRYINQAVAGYREALTKNPSSIEIHFKLIEAQYFKAYFLLQNNRDKKNLYQENLDLQEKLFSLIYNRAGTNIAIGKLLSRDLEIQFSKDSEIRNLLTRAHFWSAINWGLWGMSAGYFTSARYGVAEKIRDHAQMVIDLDPQYFDGGGYRLLGRMHSIVPYVPIFMNWISKKKGLDYLRKAYMISQKDPRNLLFLAEAILESEPQHKAEALRLIKVVAGMKPDQNFIVEQSETINQAKELLLKLTGEKS
jgi:hypothetical protein